MSKHSIKVPQLYKFASKIAEKHATGLGSIKKLVYEAHHPNLKAIYSLVVTAFQHSRTLDYLLRKSELLRKESKLNEWLARILITELLWGKKQLNGDAKPIKTILAYQQIFKAHLDNDFIDSNVLNKPKQVENPKYVRVNTLIAKTEDLINQSRDDGWIFLRNFNQTYEEYLEQIINLQPEEFTLDFHIPDLLVFAKKTQFYDSNSYKNGEIILQDKASCLAVHLLNPVPGSCVLDMCAAPGMKTTQIAALMQNQGKIYAVELDQGRYNTMNKLIGDLGVKCVETINRDVSTLTKEQVPNVEYILVDPSCSGSGMTKYRPETNGNNGDSCDQFRLKKLTGFQAVILRHALTKFPNAKRVVYSTCSLYPEENEIVVRDVLATCKNFKLIDLKEIMKDTWINYGSNKFGEIGSKCLYARPDIDHTNGFFVAMFERLQPHEQNESAETDEVNNDVTCDQMEQNESKKKKKKKTNIDEVDEQNTNEVNGLTCDQMEQNEPKKKKRKKTNNDDVDEQNPDEVTVGVSCDQMEHNEPKKKKKKKTNIDDLDEQNPDEVTNEIICDQMEENEPEKNKKKKTNIDDVDEQNPDEVTNEIICDQMEENELKKKKRKKTNNDNVDEQNPDEIIDPNTSKKTEKLKKKKVSVESIDNKQNADEINESNDGNDNENVEIKKKKKKSAKNESNDENDNENVEIKKKSAKKSKNKETSNDAIEVENQEETDSVVQAKKKKKKKRRQESSSE